MKVTSTRTRKALLKARDKDGILRVPRIDDEDELAARKAG